MFGVSGTTAAAEGIAMNVTTFPPGGASIAHKHREFETAIYGIRGAVALFHGEHLEHEVVVGRGDFCFIAPDVPHKAYNLSDAETALFVTARNDAAEQENVVATPEAEDATLADRVAEARRRFAAGGPAPAGDGVESLDAAVADLARRFRAALDPPAHAGVDVDAPSLRARLEGPLPEHGQALEEVLGALADLVEPGLAGTTGGRYLGFVTGGLLPSAAIAQAWAVAVDQNPGLWALAPAATELEQVVLGWLADLLVPAARQRDVHERRGRREPRLPRRRSPVGGEARRRRRQPRRGRGAAAARRLRQHRAPLHRRQGAAHARARRRLRPPRRRRRRVPPRRRRARRGDCRRPRGGPRAGDRRRARGLGEHRRGRPAARDRRALRPRGSVAARRRRVRRLLPALRANRAARRRDRARRLRRRRRPQVAEPAERDRLRVPSRRRAAPGDVRGHRGLPHARPRRRHRPARARRRGQQALARRGDLGGARPPRPRRRRRARHPLLRRRRRARPHRRRVGAARAHGTGRVVRRLLPLPAPGCAGG